MFTIVIPTHERPLLLRRTLQSLIAQTYQDFQVIIVSDTSTHIPPYEELLALQGRYMYLLRSGVPGPAESRNLGVTLAQTPYVMFLDDDDIFEPDHLASLARHIGTAQPELLFTDFKIRYEDRATFPPVTRSTEAHSIADVDAASVFVRNRIPNNCLVYRRDLLADIRHPTALRIYEDWDFLLACLPGRTLTHVPVNSVVIHKTPATAPENMRRGNTRDDLVVSTMLELYKRHPAPDMATRLARQALLASGGIVLGMENF